MKKIIIAFFLVVGMLVYPAFNFANLIKSQKPVSEDVKEGYAVIDSLSSYDAAKAQAAVMEVEKKRNDPATLKNRIAYTIKRLNKGKTTYRKVFRNVYIVGDSLMNGLEAYDILNSNHLITQVSASLYHLEDNMEKIIAANPPVVIIHYGINMISADEVLRNNFIRFYTRLIKEMKKELPDTRIIISGIFPVDRSVASAERFGQIGVYNKALKKMCKTLKVEYLDSSSVLKDHKECYGSDGIHLSKAFYEKYWLKYIIREKGITL